MINNIIEKLSVIFSELPGIGPRQAKRLVFAILEKDENFIKNFSSLLLELKNKIEICESCFYSFEAVHNETNKKTKCPLCENENRDKSILLIVQKEIDLENIEKSKCFGGKYFVLGGSVSLLNKNQTNKLRLRELFEKIKNEKHIKEAVLAMNTNKEGEATCLYIEKILEPFVNNRGLKITKLAKGLSSGAEIEYTDKDTLNNAFLNRK